MLWMPPPTPQRSVPCDTFVQLVGVSHPNPAKAAEFRSVDLASGRGAIEAASSAGVQHFVYVSVAHPAPMMKAYIEVRSQCEAMIRQSGLKATILRPWYVLGPGHRWPYLLLPIYKLMELFPSTREGATRLGLVTLEQMVRALVRAVETPAQEVQIVEVPQIRAATVIPSGVEGPLIAATRSAGGGRGPSTCSRRASAARGCARMTERGNFALGVTHCVIREIARDQSNSMNYESACTWDICSLLVVNEMVSLAVISNASRGPWEEKTTSKKSTSASCV